MSFHVHIHPRIPGRYRYPCGKVRGLYPRLYNAFERLRYFRTQQTWAVRFRLNSSLRFSDRPKLHAARCNVGNLRSGCWQLTKFNHRRPWTFCRQMRDGSINRRTLHSRLDSCRFTGTPGMTRLSDISGQRRIQATGQMLQPLQSQRHTIQISRLLQLFSCNRQCLIRQQTE